MRMTGRITIALAAALLILPGSGSADPLPETPITSENVQVVGNIPEVGAVGSQVRVVNTLLGPRRFFVMTSTRGVSVYDVMVPEVPVLVSHLPLPHWENEDVQFGEDVLIVSQDPQWFFAGIYGQPQLLGGIYLIDISNLPALSFAYVNPLTGNRWTEPVMNYSGHTVTCVRADCSYAYVDGSGSVSIVDLRDPSDPKLVGEFDPAVGSTHDSQVDEAGILWQVGSGGLAGYDVSDPLDPRLIVPPTSGGLQYHHNSWRPRAPVWAPRAPGEMGAPVRPGETVMITEETIYGTPVCGDQGRFQTRWVRDSDALTSGAVPTVTTLDTWQTETAVAGLTPTAPLCSAHYFDEKDGTVAITWYEQGLRFLDVSDPSDIRQVGFFIGPATVAWNVKWIGPSTLEGGEILYTTDGTRGIDIVRFERNHGAPTVVAPILPQWFSGGGVVEPVRAHPVWGLACRLAV